MSDFQADILLAESELQAKNWGLDLSAGYLYNTAAGMDVADNILYRSRIQTQLSWDVLNNGYVENKTKSKILANESAISALSSERKKSGKGDIVENWHQVIFRFNLEKLELLDLDLPNFSVDLIKLPYENNHLY